MRSEARYRTGWAGALPAGALLLALLLAVVPAGCGDLEDDPPPRPFGPGSGGPAVAAPGVAVPIPDGSGGSIGQLRYDPAFFTLTPQTPSEADPTVAELSNAATGLSLRLRLIAGRPDTPCRFDAAIAARDDGFAILGDGEDRINDREVVFHEVLLVRGATYLRLDCAQLAGNLGIEVFGVSTPEDNLGIRQVHFVLNSIRP